jgi:diaminohydroxyphosphoribosylaminopyrimidine deaminase/5-amino-6-(5-phosphoribosylamino)uracil reductase
MSDLDEKYMRMALRLAAKGKGMTSPNPRVGAVIVKNGVVTGRGWHRRAGEPHAEVIALNEAGEATVGSTLYVTLEPCSTHGRTPPCTDAIIASGVKRVVAASTDMYPAHRGRGFEILKEKGIEVTCGVLENEALKLNEGFNKYVAMGLPFVTVKAALSLDGKIATSTGQSKWISNERSRGQVHRMRNESDAIMVGIGTVKCDDPLLTVRAKLRCVNDPWKVVVDSLASVNLSCRLLSRDSVTKTIIATTRRAPKEKVEAIAAAGAQVILCREKGGKVSLRDLMLKLAKRGILYVLIEGGSRLITSALEEGLVDKVAFFYAPRIIGGSEAPSVVTGKGARNLNEATTLTEISVRRFGEDILVEGYIVPRRKRG